MSVKKKKKPEEYRFFCQHVGIFVQDIKKMSRFYIRRLGFRIWWNQAVDKKMMKKIFGINSACRILCLRLGDFAIELFDFLDVSLSRYKPKTAGYNHWTIIVRNKTRFCQDLQKNKIKIIRIPKPHGFTYFIKDPEDNLIEVKEF